jgi:hypothetical protein
MKVQYLVLLTNMIYVTLISQECISNNDNHYLLTEVNFEILKTFQGFNLKGIGLPTDLFDIISDNINLSITLNQGRLDEETKSIIHKDHRFNNKYSLFDDPSGYIIHTDNMANLDKNFLDVLLNVFKLPTTSVLDKTGIISYDNNYIISDVLDKPCTEHLDAIKEILPYNTKIEFDNKINYETFSEADYKSIKIVIQTDPSTGNIKFNIFVTYKLSRLAENILVINFNQIKFNNKILSERYLKGSIYGFDNFEYHNEFSVSNKLDEIVFIDVIPIQLDIIFSSIRINTVDFNGSKVTYSGPNIVNIVELNVEDKFQNVNNLASFSYEGRRNIHLIFKLLNAKNFKSISISYELRKKMVNFESIDNEYEFGYIFPIGAVYFINENNKYIIPTNHFYFNLPYIDAYQPFNTIALSWMVYAVILIQIMNLFLGQENSKSILQTLKDRFMAKWGFIFGR